MGKSRNAKLARREARVVGEIPKSSDLGRRDFLKFLGAGAAAAFFDGRSELDDQWAFLDKHPIKTQQEISAYVDDGSWKSFPLVVPVASIGRSPLRRWTNYTKERFKQIGEREGIYDYQIGYGGVVRMAPEMDSGTLECCVAYANHAEQFMRNELERLEGDMIVWEGVFDYSKKSNIRRRGFVGKAYLECSKYEMMHPDLRDSSSGDFVHTVEHVRKINTGGNLFYYGTGDLYFGNTPEAEMDWTAVISTNETALFTPFSESIPLSIQAREVEYFKEMPVHKRDLAGEALSEGVSLTLASKLVRELGIPLGEGIIERAKREVRTFGPKYSAVPASLAWIEDNGVQAAYDLYMDSPGKYMRAIGAWKS